MQGVIGGELLVGVLSVADEGLAVTGILFEVSQKPADALLVIFVFLALNNHLQTMSEVGDITIL